MIPPVVNILTAKKLDGYKLSISFDDGTQQIVDFHSFLSRSVHPAIHAFLDAERFADFRIEYGELVWGDYELTFPVADLYRNRIDHYHPLEEAA